MFFKVAEKYANSWSLSHKEKLKAELLLRSGHNQHRIENMKQTISSFLNQEYQREYDDLINLLPKLNGFLIYCQQNREDYTNLTCADSILNIDVLKNINMHIGSYPSVRPTTMKENYMYRNLVFDKGASRTPKVLDRADTMNEYEVAKYLHRPYHDEHLCS